MPRKSVFQVLVSMVGLAFASSSFAQLPSRARGSVKVAVVSVASLPNGHHSLVLRRPHLAPRDVILVTRDATPVDLSTAIFVLAAMRQKYGDSLVTELQVIPRNSPNNGPSNGSSYQHWLLQQLQRLRGAREFHVAGIGVAPAIAITLPAMTGQFSTPSGIVQAKRMPK